MYEEMVIGFDVREMWLEPEALTVHENWKDIFLLRKQIKKVLTTGNSWPSVFDVDDQLDELDVPRWHGGLKNNLQKMEDYVTMGWGSQWKPCWITAVTKLVDSEWKQMMHQEGYPINPRDLDENWTLLGYDVSNEWLLSGLSGLGYYPEEVQTLGKNWGRYLNEYHLLTDLQQAIDFQKMTDERVADHAPFFVYGLYLIRRAGGG